MMAPKEAGVATDPNPPLNGSSFWCRLNTLPVIQSTIQTGIGIYSHSKDKPLIGKGLGVLEYGVNLATSFGSTPIKKVTSVVEKYSVALITATKLDSLACNCLDTIETHVPAIQKSPTQIVDDVMKGTSGAIQSSVRGVLKTYPGQTVVNGLDSMIGWSRSTIDGLDESVSEDAGEDEQPRYKGAITIRLRNGVVVPLKLYLHMLRLVKHVLANMAGVQTKVRSTRGSPRKAANLEKRKRVSPKKRLQKPGLVSSLASSARSMLGLKSHSVSEEELGRSLKAAGSDSPSDPLGKCEKRKYDEDIDGSDSESESLNLGSSLIHYDSELDSDYCPEGDQSANDSLEYDSGNTESDLEMENAGINRKGEPLQQLKDKSEDQDPETESPDTSENLQPGENQA